MRSVVQTADHGHLVFLFKQFQILQKCNMRQHRSRLATGSSARIKLGSCMRVLQYLRVVVPTKRASARTVYFVFNSQRVRASNARFFFQEGEEPNWSQGFQIPQTTIEHVGHHAGAFDQIEILKAHAIWRRDGVDSAPWAAVTSVPSMRSCFMIDEKIDAAQQSGFPVPDKPMRTRNWAIFYSKLRSLRLPFHLVNLRKMFRPLALQILFN